MNNHNHITRDIKRKGECPGCDEYHNRKEDRKVNTDAIHDYIYIIKKFLQDVIFFGDDVEFFYIDRKKRDDSIEEIAYLGFEESKSMGYKVTIYWDGTSKVEYVKKPSVIID